MKKAKHQLEQFPALSKIVIGAVMILLLYFIMSAAVCAILYSNCYPISKMSFISLIILIAAGAIGSFLGIKLITRKIKYEVISFVSIAVIYLIAVLIANGRIPGVSLMNVGCFLLSSATFSYLGTRKAQRKRHRRR